MDTEAVNVTLKEYYDEYEGKRKTYKINYGQEKEKPQTAGKGKTDIKKQRENS